MRKFFLTILFTIILFSLLCITGYALRPKDTDICIKQIDTFHSLKKYSVDAVVYGSSHSWLGFDADRFAGETGLNTYNYSCYWQSFNTTWLFFHDSLKSQKPDTVLIEAGRVNDIVKNINLEGQTYYTKRIKWSKEKDSYIRRCFGNSIEKNLSYIFPVVAFHNRWERDTTETSEDAGTVDFIASKGQNISVSTVPFRSELIGARVGADPEITKEIELVNEYEGGEIGQVEINEYSIQLMKDITSTCERNGMRLIWFVIPYVGDYNYDDAMKQFVDENGGEYVNLFEYLDDMGFDSSTDMADSDHLNNSGAKKVSAFLAGYINNK